jgi:hypothetical protein
METFSKPGVGARIVRDESGVERQVLTPLNRIVARLQGISNEMREVEQRFRETMQRVAFDRVASDRVASDRVALDRVALGPLEELPVGRCAPEPVDPTLGAVTDCVNDASWRMCEVTRELMMLHARIASALRGEQGPQC